MYSGRQWRAIEEHLHDVLGRLSREAGDDQAACAHLLALLQDCAGGPQGAAGGAARAPGAQAHYMQQFSEVVARCRPKVRWGGAGDVAFLTPNELETRPDSLCVCPVACAPPCRTPRPGSPRRCRRCACPPWRCGTCACSLPTLAASATPRRRRCPRRPGRRSKWRAGKVRLQPFPRTPHELLQLLVWLASHRLGLAAKGRQANRRRVNCARVCACGGGGDVVATMLWPCRRAAPSQR